MVDALPPGDPDRNKSSQRRHRIKGEGFVLESPKEGFLGRKGHPEASGGPRGAGEQGEAGLEAPVGREHLQGALPQRVAAAGRVAGLTLTLPRCSRHCFPPGGHGPRAWSPVLTARSPPAMGTQPMGPGAQVSEELTPFRIMLPGFVSTSVTY